LIGFPKSEHNISPYRESIGTWSFNAQAIHVVIIQAGGIAIEQIVRSRCNIPMICGTAL